MSAYDKAQALTEYTKAESVGQRALSESIKAWGEYSVAKGKADAAGAAALKALDRYNAIVAAEAARS